MSRFMANEPESTFFIDVFKIALGVFIGGLLAALAYTKVMAWEMEYSLKQATTDWEKQAKQQADKSRKLAEVERQRRDADAKEKTALARQQAADFEMRSRQKQQHEAEMRAAWGQIYKPSPACQADQMTLTCANAHAAAHKRFMEIYGEMPPRF